MSSSSGGKDFHGGGDKRKTYAAWEKYDVDAALCETEKAERREDRVAATAKGHSRVAKVETTAAQEAVVGAGVLESRASVEALKTRLKRGGGGGGGRGGRRRGRGGDSDDDNSGSSSSGGDSSGAGGSSGSGGGRSSGGPSMTRIKFVWRIAGEFLVSMKEKAPEQLKRVNGEP